MTTKIVLFSFLFAGLSLCSLGQTILKVGNTAPDFTLPYATKDSIAKAPIHLAEQLGQRAIIIAFYPADWSGGCTKEVCTMRDNFEALQRLNAEVLAVSGDYVWSHFEWAKHQRLPFRLLSDHAHAVAKLYDSYNEKTMYNKRTVFVVDKSGKIAYENMSYSVADLDDFNALKTALAALR